MTGAVRRSPWSAAGVLLALVVAALLWTPAASAATAQGAAPGRCYAAPHTRLLVVATIPKVVGFTFSIAGQSYTTDASGRVQIASLTCADPERALRVPGGDFDQGNGTTATFDSWHGELHLGSSGGEATIYAAFRQRTLVHFRFVDQEGTAIPRSQLGHVVVKGSTGALLRVHPDRSSIVLDSSRVVGPSNALVSKDVVWSVQRVGINGNTAVTRGKTRFPPLSQRWVTVPLMLFPLHLTVHDALLGRPVGSVVSVVAPNGTVQTVKLGPGATAEVPALSRGRYILRAGGGSIAISFKQPVAVSRAQVADLTVVSYADVAIGGAVVLIVVLGLFLAGRLLLRRTRVTPVPSGPEPRRAGPPQAAEPENRGPTGPPPKRTEATRP
jgi:hypothetical protein